MTRTNANGHKYNETNEQLATLAESLGWVVDDRFMYDRGLMFNHGNFRVWVSTYNGMGWRKCEYIGGYAANHQSFTNAEDALRSGFEPDLTLGLGQHGLSVGQRIKWRYDVVENPNPNPTSNRDRWVDVCTEGTALFAFGEGGRFISVKHDDGLTETIHASDLRK